jgi:Arc/MetJ-type ribon-helix-helix transcriptional regulator
MSRTSTMTVRLSGALSDFVAANVGDNGSYENISEYV